MIFNDKTDLSEEPYQRVLKLIQPYIKYMTNNVEKYHLSWVMFIHFFLLFLGSKNFKLSKLNKRLGSVGESKTHLFVFKGKGAVVS